ncbi:MAG: HD domain-containing protein [Clostridiales bacterium]|nr:HD domain-containing protein [Clostridiales bacterium]
MFDLPAGAAFIISQLNDHGHRAYVVGGCVRDSLLGLEPKDWDICTSALPEEMQRIFRGQHVVETGLKHGTLTLVLDHVPYEVTTFRVDGEYTDHRHPDEVRFVQDVREDLARRDFTVNAMAYHPQEGLVDAFGGQEDLAAGVIRCVGEAERRFDEDALRILRALRFASTYCFAIEEKTAAAVHNLKATLQGVAAERIRVEVAKLLCGKGAGDILRSYHDVIGQVIPQIKPMVGFEQHTPHHRYDVWEHTIRAVEAVPATEVLRLTMLLHDSGKPAAFTMDENGVGHAYGHQKISAEIAEEVLSFLRVDNATHDRVLLLVKYHDIRMNTERTLLKRRLHKFGEEALWQLIDVQRADAMGKGTATETEIDERIGALRQALAELIASRPCVTLKDLALRGGDLIQAGVGKGKAIGACLDYLLHEVMAERLENRREALLEAALRWKMEEQG